MAYSYYSDQMRLDDALQRAATLMEQRDKACLDAGKLRQALCEEREARQADNVCWRDTHNMACKRADANREAKVEAQKAREAYYTAYRKAVAHRKEVLQELGETQEELKEALGKVCELQKELDGARSVQVEEKYPHPEFNYRPECGCCNCEDYRKLYPELARRADKAADLRRENEEMKAGAADDGELTKALQESSKFKHWWELASKGRAEAWLEINDLKDEIDRLKASSCGVPNTRGDVNHLLRLNEKLQSDLTEAKDRIDRLRESGPSPGQISYQTLSKWYDDTVKRLNEKCAEVGDLGVRLKDAEIGRNLAQEKCQSLTREVDSLRDENQKLDERAVVVKSGGGLGFYVTFAGKDVYWCGKDRGWAKQIRNHRADAGEGWWRTEALAEPELKEATRMAVELLRSAACL